MFDGAVLVQAMAQQAGFNVELEVLDWATQLDRYGSGEYQAMTFAYSGPNSSLGVHGCSGATWASRSRPVSRSFP